MHATWLVVFEAPPHCSTEVMKKVIADSEVELRARTRVIYEAFEDQHQAPHQMRRVFRRQRRLPVHGLFRRSYGQTR